MPKPSRSFGQLFLPWLAVAVWASIIFFFSAQPSLSTNLGIWDLILRKLAHFSEFGILNLLTWRALNRSGVPRFAAIGWAGLFSLLYAFSDEYHQRFVSGRSSSIRDVGVDLAGIIAAMLAAAYILRRRQDSDTIGG